MSADSLSGRSVTTPPHPVLSPIRGMEWVQRRACGPKPGETWTREQWERHDEMFHPENGASMPALAAKRVCASCPVWRECAQAAVEYDIGGVVAGVAVPTKNTSSKSGGSRARQVKVLARMVELSPPESVA